MEFSVLMSVYYKEKPEYLKEALNSLVNQTVKPSEIVLVKDGPLTSKLNAVIDDFQKKYDLLKILENGTNLGLSLALSKGLIECSFEYVARMDADDICRADRFEIQMNYISQNLDVDILGSWAVKIDSDGNDVGLLRTPLEHAKINDLIWSCPFIHPSVILKKSRIIEVGNYNLLAGPRQDDYDLWFRCAFKQYKFANLPETLLYYRYDNETLKKNNIKVGWSRFKVGFRGCIKLRKGAKAFVGISFPLIRSLLPYPLNIWFHKFGDRFNPRSR